MIVFEDIWVSYDGQPVLRGVNLHCESGKITSVIGPSGSGKSTVLRSAMGFKAPDKGRLLIEGEDVTQAGEREWRRIRRKMGMVFQHSALFDSLTVVQNVGFYPFYVEKQPWRKVRRRAMDVLTDLGLDDAANKLPGQLSGGMARRVALARSLIYHPKILLYDEPTTGLDPQNSALVSQLILQTNEKFGVTSVVVTHDLQCIHDVSDHVVMIVEGESTDIGRPQNLLTASDARVADFTAAWREQIREYVDEYKAGRNPTGAPD